MKLPSLNILLVIGVAILLTIQLKSCFEKTHLPEKMIRNEERLKFVEEKRITDSMYYVRELQVKSDSIALLKENDNTFVNKLSSNDKKIKASNNRVNDLTDAELERGFATYPN